MKNLKNFIDTSDFDLTEEGKNKIKKLKFKKEETLKKMKDDYDSGKFDEFFKEL